MTKYPAYPRYKDSGVEWLGEVPEHWKVTKLKWNVSKIGSGKTPKGGSEVYSEKGILFIRSQNVHFDGLRLEDVVYIDESIDAEMASTRVKPGDVLLNITGASIGRCSYVPEDFPAANVNQHVSIIRPIKRQLNSQFLSRVISSNYIQIQIHQSEYGVSREGLTSFQIGNFYIAIPTLGEQKQIADYLNNQTTKIDKLISKQEQMIELLKEKRQALISHAVTKGLNPNVPMKDSGVEWLGKVPEHWRIVRIKNIAQINYGLGQPPKLSDQGVPIIRAMNIKNGRISTEGMIYAAIEDIPLDRAPLLKKGEIIVARSGANTGDSAIIPAEFEGAVPGYDLRVTPQHMVSEFLAYCLLSSTVLSQIEIVKTRAAQPHLNAEELGDCVVCFPPIYEQQEISIYLEEKLRQIDSTIDKIKEAIELLKVRRSSLISAAVTGKIDVRGLVPQEVKEHAGQAS